MPRGIRIKSASNIYHVILRGNNQQIIFENKYDYQYFLKLLKEFKEIYGYEIYAYCLMDNHIHLCLKIEMKDLQEMMQRIEIKFVRWYNGKYKRCGHLFQGRFKSEPVDSEAYLLTLFRYIHQNPMKAKLEVRPGFYKWSSYQDYVKRSSELVNTSAMMRFFNDHQEMISFLNSSSNDSCMEYYSSNRIPDEIATDIIKSITGLTSVQAFPQISLQKRNYYILMLLNQGISVRQMNRLTGISKRTIEKIWKE